MSAAWPQISLGELCLMEKGTSPTLKTLPGEFPLVVTADFRRSADSWQIEGPAVCIPLISSTGHGDAALHRVHYQEGKFALANLLVALTPKDSSVCSAKYLYHLLMARKDDLLVPLMQGTANVSLKEKDIATVEIPLPPLAKQRRIVARIEELAAKVDEAQKLRRQALLEAEALLRSSSRNVFSEEKGHGSAVLESLCTEIIDCLHSNAIYADGGIPTLRSPDIGWGKLLPDTALKTSEEEYLRRTRRGELIPGDIIIVREGGGTGKAGIVEEGQRMSLGQRVMQIRPDQSRVLPRFFLHQWLSPLIQEDQIIPLMKGSAAPHLNISAVRKFKVMLPSISEQHRIVAYLDDLQAKVDAVKHLQTTTAAELNAMLPSIMDKAFKGEL